MSVIVDGSNGLIFNDASTQTTAATGFGFKNRIINGAMVIDQRNAGASTNNAGSATTYSLDRWAYYGPSSSKFSIQQSSTAPVDFVNSLVITSLAATSMSASAQYLLRQAIEGYNIADLNWGSANAKTVTLSFWVRSSLTGTFGGSITNGDVNRSYPFTFTINSANTWEYETITITGPTSGSWNTTNGTGLRLYFALGAGSDYNGTAGAWATVSDVTYPAGSTNILGTNGATFYITGVQLERGSTATTFDYRSFGTEVQLCQRYYEKSFDLNTAPVAGVTNNGSAVDTGIISYSGNAARNIPLYFKVSKRTSPTMVMYAPGGYGATSGNNPVIYNGGWNNVTSFTPYGFQNYMWMDVTSPVSLTTGSSYLFSFGWSASAEL